MSLADPMADIFIHQIFYDEDSRAKLLPGFLPLDNTRNERPDWFEFPLILDFLRHNSLQDDAWYGFVSPKFKHKTGMAANAVIRKIQTQGQAADVLVLTVAWDQVAYYLNPWEQGEVMHPGILDLSQRFLDHAAYPVDLKTLVCDSFSTQFANYVVAKKNFWLKWQVLAEKFWSFVEHGEPEADGMSEVTHYFGQKTHYTMKTFVQERFASLILATGDFRVIKSDPSDVRAPNAGLFTRTLQTRRLLQTCDLMKTQYRRTQDPAFLAMYWKVRACIDYKAPRVSHNEPR